MRLPIVLLAVAGLLGTNQNAYECVVTVPSCPRKPDRTLVYAVAGIVVGAALGALVVHAWSILGR